MCCQQPATPGPFCPPVLCAFVQLEQQIQQLDEQRQHVALQLEQLEGLEGGRDQLGVADLQQQLQVR